MTRTIKSGSNNNPGSQIISPAMRVPRAFTLIELLIVVAIIAILALIAVPNFLDAQTRAKVSRVRSDLRTIATALESYAVAENNYPPNDGNYNVVPIQITTPVAYITNSRLVDPFSDKINDPVHGDLSRFYTYTKIVTANEALALITSGGPAPPVEGIDSPAYNSGAFSKYGRWRLVSNGPDRIYSLAGTGGMNPSILLGADILYDPTNGTISFGNILRTQKSPVGSETGS